MISKNAGYWIWLTMTLGYNNPKVKRIFELYPDIKQFYNGGEKEWRFCGIFTENEINLKLFQTRYAGLKTLYLYGYCVFENYDCELLFREYIGL